MKFTTQSALFLYMVCKPTLHDIATQIWFGRVGSCLEHTIQVDLESMSTQNAC